MDSSWIEAFKYHRWANTHLMGKCTDLTEGQLQLTTPGTYGTIAATWMHLVGAEERYIQRLGGSQAAYKEKDGFPGLARLAQELARSDDELIDIAGRTPDDHQFETDFSGGRHRIHAAVILIQAVHHGNDHRTHICTVLGAHGVEYGDMDVWAYGDATGSIVKVGA